MTHSNTPHNGWLAFELSVLNRIKFRSVAIPFAGSHDLGTYLKRAGVRVLANDLLQSTYSQCAAHILNDNEDLTREDIEAVLEDAYVPQYRLRNPALRNWFDETDAWWFDNVRANIERLGSNGLKWLALSAGMKVGDYVLSFDDETRMLRQPLSRVFERLVQLEEAPAGNGEENVCKCTDPADFTAESYTDLFFLRLPAPRRAPLRESLGADAWKECWVRSDDGFWGTLEHQFRGRLGSYVETRSQYIESISNLLETARHIKQWAIAHVEDGFVHTQDVVDCISAVRKVDTVFTKDFSELTGNRAVIITA